MSRLVLFGREVCVSVYVCVYERESNKRSCGLRHALPRQSKCINANHHNINQTHVLRGGLCAKRIFKTSDDLVTSKLSIYWCFWSAFPLRATAEYLKSKWKGRHESVTVMTGCCWHDNQTFNHERAAFVFSLHIV